jgi:hypothetical protein
MKRRDVLRFLTSAAALPLADALSGEWEALGREVHAAMRTEESAPFRSLDGSAARIVAAACERIIPTDDTPGAAAVGVPAFIDRVLTDWCDPAERSRFFDGVQAIDARSRTAHEVPFADASEAQQTTLLEELDEELSQWRRTTPPAGAAPGVQALPAHGFGMLKFLTVWGYFTSEVGQRQELGVYPRPTTYDGCAPYVLRQRRAVAAPDANPRATEPT